MFISKKKIVEFFVDLFNVVSVCVCDEEIITRINNKQRFFGLLKNTIKFWKIIELLSKQWNWNKNSSRLCCNWIKWIGRFDYLWSLSDQKKIIALCRKINEKKLKNENFFRFESGNRLSLFFCLQLRPVIIIKKQRPC